MRVLKRFVLPLLMFVSSHTLSQSDPSGAGQVPSCPAPCQEGETQPKKAKKPVVTRRKEALPRQSEEFWARHFKCNLSATVMQSAYRMKLQGYSPQYAFPFLKGSEEERKYLSEKEVKKIINMIYFSGIELSGTHSSSENTAIYKLCMNGWKSPQFTPLK